MWPPTAHPGRSTTSCSTAERSGDANDSSTRPVVGGTTHRAAAAVRGRFARSYSDDPNCVSKAGKTGASSDASIATVSAQLSSSTSSTRSAT